MMRTGPEVLVVTADDRSGALETGAACADQGHTVEVVASPGDGVCAASVRIIDLGSRHLSSGEANERMRSAIAASSARGERLVGHKIDSTLRGRWPDEVHAVVAAGHRVLVVPAHPALGRACVAGVVTVDGVPVHLTAHGADGRAPVRSSRPAEMLGDGVELADLDAVTTWLRAADSSPVAVADAADLATIDSIARAVGECSDLARPILCGPAVVAASALAVLRGTPAHRWEPRMAVPPPSPGAGHVVVVVGSRHENSRLQVQRLIEGGVTPVLVDDLQPTVADTEQLIRDVIPIDHGAVVVIPRPEWDAAPDVVVARLAEVGWRFIGGLTAQALVVSGGDTAAACLGRRPVRMSRSLHGVVAVGTVDGASRPLTLVSKPGAHGGADTLSDMLQVVRR